MAVYVDESRNAGWKYGRACHMTADTFAELHAMADKIGLSRHWYQNHPRFPHYDLTDGKRAAAIKAGAIEQRRPVRAKDA